MDSQEGEIRKIQFSGKSSFMLALPKQWADEMGLGQGDQVAITRHSNVSLLVTPRKFSGSRPRNDVVVMVSSGESVDYVVRQVISLYVTGRSAMHIVAKEGRLSSAQKAAIKLAVRKHLIGTEVVADSNESITVQVLLSYPELNVENVIKRMSLVTASMLKESVQSLVRGNREEASEVIRTDDEVDRFSLYLFRQLNLAAQSDKVLKDVGLNSSMECMAYGLVGRSIERVADHATRIAQEVFVMESPLEDALSLPLVTLTDFASGLLDESVLSLFKRDYGGADKVVERAKLFADMEKGFLEGLQRSKGTVSYYAMRHVVEAIRRTAEYSSDIAEMVLNTTVHSRVKEAVEDSPKV